MSLPDDPAWISLAGVTVIQGASVTGDINAGQHVTAVVASASVAGAGSGIGAPNPVALPGCCDPAGTVTFGSGTVAAAGAQAAVTFSVPWVIPGGSLPHVVLSPGNAATVPLGLYADTVTASGFHICVAVAPPTFQPASTYVVHFVVLG